MMTRMLIDVKLMIMLLPRGRHATISRADAAFYTFLDIYEFTI